MGPTCCCLQVHFRTGERDACSLRWEAVRQHRCLKCCWTAGWCSAVSYGIVLCCIVLYCIVLCCILLYCMVQPHKRLHVNLLQPTPIIIRPFLASKTFSPSGLSQQFGWSVSCFVSDVSSLLTAICQRKHYFGNNTELTKVFPHGCQGRCRSPKLATPAEIMLSQTAGVQ